MKKLSFLIVTIMLLNMWLLPISAEIPQPNSSLDDSDFKEESTIISDQITPVASTNATIWATTNKATNLVSAPYDDISVTIASLASGSGFYIIERDYGYFYVYRIFNNKYQRGYVKISDVDCSSYEWVNHNVFEKGVTKFTTSSQEVLSGPGTTNTYEHVGSIYQGENPLLVLRTELNTYNNVTYAFIQYMVTDTGKFKRGWVPYSAISVQYASSDDALIDNGKIFYLESVATGKMIQATSTSAGSTALQQPKGSTNSQLFKIEKASTGYYRFILQSNTELSLQVMGNQMAEGAQLGVYYKGTASGPSKSEEFEVTLNDDGSYHLKSRCTGRYRSVDLYGGSAANGTKIISSKTTNASNQRWNLQPKILGGKDISVIKVGDSTGRACVSMYNAFDNLNVYYADRENLTSTANVSKNTNFSLNHVKFAIKNSSVFYINGHGLPTPSIMADRYNITPSNIGFSTSDRTRWGILNPCDQLNEDGSAVEWARYALRNGVRGILGYFDTAPGDSGSVSEPQVEIIADFTDRILNGSTFVTAWKRANGGLFNMNLYGESTWAIIYHDEAEGDTLSTYNTSIDSPSTSAIYYVRVKTEEETSSVSTINELNSVVVGDVNRSISNQKIESKDWHTINGMDVYEKSGYDMMNSNPIKINKSTALHKVGQFLKENDTVLCQDADIKCGTVVRSRLSDDSTCFVDEEILAYTFTVNSSDTNEGHADMYFEVNDSGVVNFIST